MTKTDLIAQVAEKTSLTKKDSAAAIDAVLPPSPPPSPG